MSKNARWICLNHPCGMICVSRAAAGDTFCTCGHYCQSGIELRKLSVSLGRIDPSKCHFLLSGRGWSLFLKEVEERKAVAARWGHLDWQQTVDDEVVLDALDRCLARRCRQVK